MSLINCESNLDLNWSEKCVKVAKQCRSRHNILNNWYKIYVPVVTLSTQDNAKLLEQLKSGFKITINWNRYQQKVSTKR